MLYETPSLEVVETFESAEVFYAPKIPWMTVLACVLVTIGTTLTNK
jgi:hypothetical protein